MGYCLFQLLTLSIPSFSLSFSCLIILNVPLRQLLIESSLRPLVVYKMLVLVHLPMNFVFSIDISAVELSLLYVCR